MIAVQKERQWKERERERQQNTNKHNLRNGVSRPGFGHLSCRHRVEAELALPLQDLLVSRLSRFRRVVKTVFLLFVFLALVWWSTKTNKEQRSQTQQLVPDLRRPRTCGTSGRPTSETPDGRRRDASALPFPRPRGRLRGIRGASRKHFEWIRPCRRAQGRGRHGALGAIRRARAAARAGAGLPTRRGR